MNIGTLTFCTLLCVKGRLQNQILDVQMCSEYQHTLLPTSVFSRTLYTFDKGAADKTQKAPQNVYLGEREEEEVNVR